MNLDNLAEDILSGIDRKKVVKPRSKYHRAGRGRKHCPDCDSYLGVRTLICECGHEFVKGESKPFQSVAEKNKKFDEPISDEDRRYAMAVGLTHGCRIIHVGAGACPAKLKTTDYKGITEFCEDIVASGITEKKLYLPSAIKRWLRDIVPADDEDYEYICGHIDQWYNDKVESTMGLEI